MIKKKLINNNYALWFYPNNLKFKPVSEQEKKWSESLSNYRKKEYLFSRGYLRHSLANLFGIENLEIPLFTPPGKAPILKDGLGFISISHCCNGLAIAWSSERIGIDIESLNRKFDYKLLAKRFFFDAEKNKILKSDNDMSRQLALTMWVLKEAAIKWEEGKLFSDLEKWETNGGSVRNSLKNIELNAYKIKHKSWIIGFVIKNKINSSKPIIIF